MKHMTASWLRKYANLNKLASYQDKMDAVYAEKNPYYLLEWLLFPLAEEEAEMIRFSRSPSMVKNSYLDFTEVFFDQIIYEIGFKAYPSAYKDEWLLNIAIRDLREFYSQEVWEHAVKDWDDHIQLTWTKVKEFEQQLEREQSLISSQYRDQIREIKEDFAENSMEEQDQLKNARDLHEQKQTEAPRKLLQKKYKSWPLVSFVHHNKRGDMKEQLFWLKEQLLKSDVQPIESFIEHSDYASVMELIQSNEEMKKKFIYWFPAYASKTLMTVQYVNTQNRQKWWLGFLQYMNGHKMVDEASCDLWDITYKINGIDETMMKESIVPLYFHHLVSFAAHHSEHRRWLREVVILRYWDVFIRAFSKDYYEYESLSWVLCLDPESLELKLIRGLQQKRDKTLQHRDLTFIIDRVSQIFTDAINRGMNAERMVPLFKYLTIHHIDFVYSYIQRLKQAEQFFPILHMDISLIQRLFSGKGIRAVGARKALQHIFLTWLDRIEYNEINRVLLKQWSGIYEQDKGDLLQQWLDQQEKKSTAWPQDQASELEELLQFEWLGKPGIREKEHEQVKAWLAQNSDWVKFELDTQASHREGVKYRILRPGYKDLITGQVLARVKVRAEVTDAKEISNLLDDLKNL